MTNIKEDKHKKEEMEKTYHDRVNSNKKTSSIPEIVGVTCLA